MLINKCNMKNKFKVLSNILSILKHLLFIHLDCVGMNAVALDLNLIGSQRRNAANAFYECK